MKVSPSGVWSLIRQTFGEWSEDKAPQLGAALAFYTALSILWRRRFFCRTFSVGVLLIADSFLRCRAHSGIRQPVRIQDCAGQKRRAAERSR